MVNTTSLNIAFAFVITVAIVGAQNRAQAQQQETQSELPTAPDVVGLHIKSLGGRAALENVKNMTTRASVFMTTPFGKVEMEMTYLQAGKKSLSITKSGQFGEMKQGSNGEIYWIENPTIGAKIIDGPEKAAMKEQMGAIFPVLEWNNYAGTITVIGKSKVEGRDCFQLEFAPTNGPKTSRFFDAENGQIVQISTKMGNNGTVVRVLPTDYRTVNGITMPFKQSTFLPNPQTGDETEMVTQITEILINTTMDDSVFALPAAIKQQLNKN